MAEPKQLFLDRGAGEHRHPLFTPDVTYWNEPVYDAEGNKVGYLQMQHPYGASQHPFGIPMRMTPLTPEQLQSVVLLDEKSET